ncbi:competence protein [Pararhodobacter oceanensis]|uniref:Competence protein n=2 Tax=Pararhodobacter oceanensis TaxID=2172121 RepID=A0A2T8HZ06_9RHOB|nr:ComEC/Rec2 family competence protein [Pararhodobacter oceanensis]PVH30631.1 competence protein [Pararhodobacter oceanensis]
MVARGHLFPFVPVFLGAGVGVYFAGSEEPTGGLLLGVALAASALLGAALRGPELARPVFLALSLMALGFAAAGLRTRMVEAPVLGWQRYGPIEGRIVAVDRSASGAVRLTLDRVVLAGLEPERTPVRVRISLHGGPLDVAPIAGTRVMMTGHLAPPSGPTEPGGFDFRRHAWFARLGAVGYTRAPVVAWSAPETGFTPGIAAGIGLALTRLRHRMSAGIRARLPGETGGFVAAILTGDRSGVGLAMTEALRRSNLAHLLAISGLHMGLLTGVVYGGARAALALIPALALYWPIRKIAALCALMAALGYLALSGGNIATQRAFVMAAAMLVAVLIDRRAISMRSVALAALIVLVWRPESLLSAGFQMSFAATVALVAVFRALRERRQAAGGKGRPTRAMRLLRVVATAALCSLVAGLATAPIAAAQFHRFTDYGLLANLLSVPLMGLLVMPAAVASALLWPVGLEGVGLWLMELGTRWILFVAQTVGGSAGAVRLVAAPPVFVVPLLALGGLWLALWPGRARWAGVVLAGVAALGWASVERPALLIDRGGALVGLMTPEGRALSRARGAGFVARHWLEADGDAATQEVSAARGGFTPVAGGVRFRFAGADWLHLRGVAGEAALPAWCREGMTIVTDIRLEAPPSGACRLLDPRAFRRSGAIALYEDGREVTARQVSGARPWVY